MPDSPGPKDELISGKEACLVLRISRKPLLKLIEAGELSVYRPPLGRPRLYRAEVEALKERSRTRGEAAGMI